MSKQSDKETMRRVDDALKRASSMRHKSKEALVKNRKSYKSNKTIPKGRMRTGKAGR
jgi:hypothetical protein